LPEAAQQLLHTVRLRWLAAGIGFERLYSQDKAVWYRHFVADPQSSYYQSEAFTHVLHYVQTNPRTCAMRQKGEKLTLTFREREERERGRRTVAAYGKTTARNGIIQPKITRNFIPLLPGRGRWCGTLIPLLPRRDRRSGTLIPLLPERGWWGGTLIPLLPERGGWSGTFIPLLPGLGRWSGTFIQLLPGRGRWGGTFIPLLRGRGRSGGINFDLINRT
jgi:hypothetical protein